MFERTSRRVLVTPAGAQLLERARQMVTGADDLLAMSRQLRDPFSGTLRVGVIPTLSPYVLPEAAPTLKSKCPALTLLWTEEKTAALLSSLRAGELDAVVVARLAGMEDLELEHLADDGFVLAGPKDHALLASSKPAHPSDLKAQQVLLLDDGHCFRDQALAICSRSRATESDFRATSLSTLARMAAGGAGLTLLPELSLKVENRRGDLAIRRFARPGPMRKVVLAWRSLRGRRC